MTTAEIKTEFLSTFNESLDDLITDTWLTLAINRWQRELLRRRPQWSFLRDIVLTDLTEDKQKYALPTDIASYSTSGIVSVKYHNQPEIPYIDQSLLVANTYDWIGNILKTSITGASVTVVLNDSSDFADSGTIYIEGDAITYTGNTTSTGTLTGVTGITASHTAGAEVWQTFTTGDPQAWTINGSNIQLFPLPGSVQAGKNLTIEYWQKFPTLTDSDTTLFPWPDNCLKFLAWQLAIRRKLPISDQNAKEQIWMEEVNDLVAQDPEFRDILIQPNNIYVNPY